MPRGVYKRKSLEERFWKAVKKGRNCWKWEGAKNTYGYGVLGKDGKIVRAHRFSYEYHFGKIPKGLFVLHSCDNPPCVNPKHLFVGTNKDNMEDKVRKGRARSPMKDSSDIAAALGRLGGTAMYKKRGKKHMSEMGKKGAASRWGNKKANKK